MDSAVCPACKRKVFIEEISKDRFRYMRHLINIMGKRRCKRSRTQYFPQRSIQG